jgi:hypothetical protein
MSTDTEQDLALTALLAAAKDTETTLPDSFIQATYAIQRRHQFNHDETISLHNLEKLVEYHVGQSQGEGS